MMAISGLIQLLLYLLIGGLIVYVVYWIIGMTPLPQPVKNVVGVIVAIIVLLWLLGAAGIMPRMW
jgi:hypothetical protein